MARPKRVDILFEINRLCLANPTKITTEYQWVTRIFANLRNAKKPARTLGISQGPGGLLIFKRAEHHAPPTLAC